MPVPKLTVWPRDAERQPFDTASWNRWINFSNGDLSAPQVWAQDSGVPGLTWSPQTPLMTLAAPLVASGTVSITGPLTVSNTAAFSGAVTITGPSLAVSAPTTMTSTVGISGTLTASGAVAITGPSLAVTPLATFAGGITLSGGNLALSGTGQRITGDFSNATTANRLLFQSSVVNGATVVSAIPNGTGNTCDFSVYNAANPAAASWGLFRITGTDLRIVSSHTGAAFLPIQFYTNATKQLEIAGNGDITVASQATGKLGFFAATPVVRPGTTVAATDLPTAITLANALRTGLRALGLFA